MRARITVQPDVNTIALARILAENGVWLIYVHNRRIVKLARVPKGQPVEALVADAAVPENHSETG
jgi:hypothetical protein